MEHVFRYRIPGAGQSGQDVVLDADASHHLSRVVRRDSGAQVEVVDEAGRIWPAEVVDAGPPARVHLAEQPRIGPPRVPLRLFVGIAEPPRLDLVVEKGTELGIASIGVFTSERADHSLAKRDWSKRRARLLRVADAAALQAGRGVTPEISGVLAFADVLTAPAPDHGHLLDPETTTALDAALARVPRGDEDVCLLVGPPAGFSRAEVDAAREAGMTVSRLGEGVLRTETAAIAAMAIALGALGHLGGSA